jgi:hypothetical protein
MPASFGEGSLDLQPSGGGKGPRYGDFFRL